MRRKVPNVMRSRSKLTTTNLTSDKLGDVKNYYGWTEKQLEKNVRAHYEGQNQSQLRESYKKAYLNKG